MHKTWSTLCKWPLHSLSYDLYSVLDNQKASKNSFQATTFKVEENSSSFQGLAQKFKDFSRTSPKIQGLFKTVWTLCRFEETQALIGFIYISFWNLLLQKTVQVSGGLSCQGQLNVKFAILIIYSYWFFSTSVYSIKFNLFVTWLSFFMIKRDQFVWPIKIKLL